MKRIFLAGAPALVVILAACSASDQLSTSPTRFAISADDSAAAVVVSSSDATAEDVDVMLASDVSMDGSGLAADAVGTPSFTSSSSADAPRIGFWDFSHVCAFNSSARKFTCPGEHSGGLTLTRTVTFYDASGNAMPTYDSLTASANYQTSVSGVRTVNHGADTLSRQRNFTATGLLGHETSRTWNGTASRNDGGYRTDSAMTRTYHVSDNSTTTNVVVDLPRNQHPYPMSGTVARHVSGNGSVDRNGTTETFTVARDVTITFNGTRYVPMTVGGVAYTLDLQTGKASKN